MPPPPEVTTILEADSPVATAPSARSTPRWLHILIAVLLLAGAVVLWRGVRSASPSDPAAHNLTLVAPAAGAAHEELTVFVWRPAPGAVTYLLQVLDQADRVVVSGETVDTTLLMAEAALPAAATSLRWRVIARQSDGTEVRSQDRQLR